MRGQTSSGARYAVPEGAPLWQRLWTLLWLSWDRLSLRLKLTLGYALIFSVSVVLGALCVFLLARGSLTSTLDTTLHETASLARGSLVGSGPGQHFTDALKPPPELSLELLSAGGKVLDVAGQPLSNASVPVLAPARLGVFSHHNRRVLTETLPGGLLLQISRDSDTLTALLETLARVLLTGSVLMIALACVAGYYLADRALKPVDAVARTADSITRSGSYRGRVPPAPGTDEMARLTGTVNSMLDHLEATIEREKSFARTAAHELRTPLTALQGRLELALERPREAADYRRSLEIMQGRVDELLSLAQGLLALAETDRPAALELMNLSAQASEVTGEMHGLSQRLGKQLGWQESGLMRPGSAESGLPGSALSGSGLLGSGLLGSGLPEAGREKEPLAQWVWAEPLGVRQVLRNLLENALKYGGPRVMVRVTPHALTVWDSGPGPLPQEWARLARPFERGAGLQGVSGSGLGLPLVMALAQRWDARVEPFWEDGGFGVRLSWAAREASALN
ncbi:sensor histidine kinase [Deinococcus altitudinis]|uniref:sensor histidine kinase n=1 Tax=Deinococcus altitudinis TaxID=468914 RepID=UPI00389178E8